MLNMNDKKFHSWFKQKYRLFSDGGKKSVNQFASWLEISQSTVNAIMNETRGVPRSQKIIDKLVIKYGVEARSALGLDALNITSGVSIPLLGRIAAGTAIAMPKLDFPPYGSDSSVPILRAWLPTSIDIAGLFALEVEGDSMVEEGINDGDTIIMRKTDIAENGDLVAVRLDDDDAVTLKKFYRQNGTVILQPANSKMQPIVVPASKVHVEGKIVISIRKWK